EAQTDETYRAAMRDALTKADDVKEFDPAVWEDMKDRVHWVAGNLTEPAVYAELASRLAAFEEKLDTKKNRLFYFAVPPFLFEPIPKNLSASGLLPRVADPKARPWRRVIVEKPFGRSLATAQELSRAVLSVFAEPQIYRIDHYVGKETVQNVLVFR